MAIEFYCVLFKPPTGGFLNKQNNRLSWLIKRKWINLRFKIFNIKLETTAHA